MPKIKDLPKRKRPGKKLSEKGANNLSDAKSQIIIYKTETGKTKIDVRFDGDTVWLTQNALADLLQTTKQNISQHIKNIFDEGELQSNSVVKNFLTTATDGKNYVTNYYNLDLAKKKPPSIQNHLKESSTIRKYLTVQKEGNRQNDFDSVALRALEIAKKKPSSI